MLSFKLKLPSLLIDDVLNVLSKFSIVRMVFWIPLKEFFEDEALPKFDGVLTIESSLNLHRESRCLVVSIEDPQRWKRSGWLNVVSKVHLWVSSHEVKDIIHTVVVVSDLDESHVVVDSVATRFKVFVNIISKSNKDIYCNFGIIVHFFSAPLNS